MINLPNDFIGQMRALLGEPAWEAFHTSLNAAPPVSIRLNPTKNASLDLPLAERVPWHPNGFYLQSRPVFTLDPAFHAGAYYVQEASSMLLHEVLQQTLPTDRPLKVLDLCAAPGGKSTLLANWLPPGSLLVANETVRTRASVLRENLEKWGHVHLAVTNAEAGTFASLPHLFDAILVDAPCSGEGLFRKDPGAVQEWSLDQVQHCANRQKQILADVLQALKPGGVLIYSTCTYNTAENEQNTAWLSHTYALSPMPCQFPEQWGIRSAGTGYQCYPHLVRGEGFFIAAFKKTEDHLEKNTVPASFKALTPFPKSKSALLKPWLNAAIDVQFFQTPAGDVLALPTHCLNDYLLLDKYLKFKWFGVYLGALKGNDLIPGHALALSRLVHPDFPGLDLDREHALRYLKKELADVPETPHKGWMLAQYKGLNLGWLKVLPNRINNYLPLERRIRMDLDQ